MLPFSSRTCFLRLQTSTLEQHLQQDVRAVRYLSSLRPVSGSCNSQPRPQYRGIRTSSTRPQHYSPSSSSSLALPSAPRRSISKAPTMTSAHCTPWSRLIRYVSAKDGQIRYGEPIVSSDASSPPDIDQLALSGELKVKVLAGATPFVAEPTGEEDSVKQLLGPLTPKDVPIVRCTGLNYKTHILETGFDLPANPTLFLKPPTAVTDTRAAIPIPPLGQAQCDYEGELTIVIGRDGKNVSEADALDYVAGYVAGNDVSCRDWQMDKAKAGMMPQWCFSKSFDAYAPLGPAIVSPRVLGDGSGLALRTLVNGELRQETNTSDLCFGVRKLVSFFSTGQTLQAGSLIMTGTPGGVGLGFKPEPKWLKDGDEVAVEIEGVGRVVNVMKFE